MQKSVASRGDSDLVSGMPIISADGRAWKLLVVFGGNEHILDILMVWFRRCMSFYHPFICSRHRFLPLMYRYSLIEQKRSLKK